MLPTRTNRLFLTCGTMAALLVVYYHGQSELVRILPGNKLSVTAVPGCALAFRIGDWLNMDFVKNQILAQQEDRVRRAAAARELDDPEGSRQ
jgi:hypothetical protein